MAGEKRAALGQRKDLAAHRAEQRLRVALLKVRAAAAADQQRIAGKGHRAVVEHIRHAAAGVARGCAGLQVAFSKLHPIFVIQILIGALSAA